MRVITFLLGLLLLGTGSALAFKGFLSLPSQLDPLLLQQPMCTSSCTSVPYTNTSLLAPTTTVYNPAARNLVLIVVGDLNTANYAPTPYVVTNTNHVFMVNIYDGAAYAYAAPVLGPTWDPTTNGAPGEFTGRLADDLINNNIADNVYIMSIGEANFEASDWDTGILSDRILVAYRRLTAAGLPLHGILWGQGEYDNSQGVSGPTYQAAVSDLVSNLNAAGVTAPFFVAEETMFNGTPSGALQTAQLALVNNTTIFAGPNADAITTAERQGDMTTFNDNGMQTYAGIWTIALANYGPPF